MAIPLKNSFAKVLQEFREDFAEEKTKLAWVLRSVVSHIACTHTFGVATGVWVGQGSEDLDTRKGVNFFSAPPKIGERGGPIGSDGALTFHCYYLTNKDN